MHAIWPIERTLKPTSTFSFRLLYLLINLHTFKIPASQYALCNQCMLLNWVFAIYSLLISLGSNKVKKSILNGIYRHQPIIWHFVAQSCESNFIFSGYLIPWDALPKFRYYYFRPDVYEFSQKYRKFLQFYERVPLHPIVSFEFHRMNVKFPEHCVTHFKHLVHSQSAWSVLFFLYIKPFRKSEQFRVIRRK